MSTQRELRALDSMSKPSSGIDKLGRIDIGYVLITIVMDDLTISRVRKDVSTVRWNDGGGLNDSCVIIVIEDIRRYNWGESKQD